MSTNPPPSQPASSRPDDAPPFRYTAALADQFELRWQNAWDDAGTYRVANPGEPGFHGERLVLRHERASQTHAEKQEATEGRMHGG